MKNKKGFILSTYVYILLVFFLLLLGTMLVVLNNTKLLSNKLKEGTQSASGLIDKDYSFVLLGNKEEIIRKDEEYIDKGFIAKTVKGVDLTEYVITETSVDTSVIGDYEISYKVTYNGVTKELTRIVHVVDNKGISYLNTLYQYRKDENGLIIDDTKDENLRYAGSNEDVKNYVEFGNEGELWRIIGIFDTQTEEGGVELPRIKLVRDKVFTDEFGKTLYMSWDSSDSTVNSGYGINQWGESTYEDGSYYEGADIMRLLNGYYLGEEGEICIYCNDESQATCPTTNDCSSSIQPVKSTYIGMIDNILWNVGSKESNDTIAVLDIYNAERGQTSGKLCSSGVSCNDTVKRTVLWEGKVGLIYPSDYGYASDNVDCLNNINGTDSTCYKGNWLNINKNYFTLTPYSIDIFPFYVWGIYSLNRNIELYGVRGANGIRPSVYLKPDIKIISGIGTETDPYKLSL